jgi:hypothetical protein
MHEYKGGLWADKAEAILKAWGAGRVHVVEDYDILHADRVVMAEIDGKWYQCRFSSSGGTPTAHCSSQGYEAETGEIAVLRRQMAGIDREIADSERLIGIRKIQRTAVEEQVRLARQAHEAATTGRIRHPIQRPDYRNNGKYQFVKSITGSGAEACVHLTAEEIAERTEKKHGPGKLVDDGTDLWWEVLAKKK